jgi:hypothetical protein
MCQVILPTGIAHRIRSCTDGHLTDHELAHYQEAIALLDEDFEQEDTEGLDEASRPADSPPAAEQMASELTIGNAQHTAISLCEPNNDPAPPIQSMRFFARLDQFACEWSLLENTGPLILQVYDPVDLQVMLTADSPPVREFGFIMLRLALTDSVPWDAVPLLCELFTDYFDNAPFLSRLYIAKVFLAIFPDMGHDMCQVILPTGIAHRIRSCTDGLLTDHELAHYQEAIALLDEDFEQEDEEEREDGRD